MIYGFVLPLTVLPLTVIPHNQSVFLFSCPQGQVEKKNGLVSSYAVQIQQQRSCGKQPGEFTCIA